MFLDVSRLLRLPDMPGAKGGRGTHINLAIYKCLGSLSRQTDRVGFSACCRRELVDLVQKKVADRFGCKRGRRVRTAYAHIHIVELHLQLGGDALVPVLLNRRRTLDHWLNTVVARAFAKGVRRIHDERRSRVLCYKVSEAVKNYLRAADLCRLYKYRLLNFVIIHCVHYFGQIWGDAVSPVTGHRRGLDVQDAVFLRPLADAYILWR